MTTLLIENPAGLGHLMPPGHPEQVARLEAVTDALAAQPFRRALSGKEAPLAEEADLLLGHPQAYVDRIRAAMPRRVWSRSTPTPTQAPDRGRPRSRASAA